MTALITEPCEFWCVWTKKGHKPRFVHETEESARTEAARLAEKNPGAKYIVMRAYEKVHVPAVVEVAEGAAA